MEKSFRRSFRTSDLIGEEFDMEKLR